VGSVLGSAPANSSPSPKSKGYRIYRAKHGKYVALPVDAELHGRQFTWQPQGYASSREAAERICSELSREETHPFREKDHKARPGKKRKGDRFHCGHPRTVQNILVEARGRQMCRRCVTERARKKASS